MLGKDYDERAMDNWNRFGSDMRVLCQQDEMLKAQDTAAGDNGVRVYVRGHNDRLIATKVVRRTPYSQYVEEIQALSEKYKGQNVTICFH